MADEIDQWLEDYKSVTSIEGWMDARFLDLMKVINQMTTSVPGGALEIGVHHGKFFMACNALADAHSTSVAVDVFGDQQLNIDRSGHGNREAFEHNLAAFGRHSASNTIVVSADSTTLSADELLAKTSGVKFKVVSIDGGHTAEHTISDIMLSADVVNDLGFIIVDDFLNHHWLGVIDGITTYLRGRPKVWPLATAFNKLIMCKMSLHPSYRQSIGEAFPFAKTTVLCGYDILAA